MFALSLLDIPFSNDDKKQNIQFEDVKMTLESICPLIIFHKEIKETKTKTSTVLINQNYFDPLNRYEYENNEKIEKYIQEEFLSDKVYGCQIVITNVSCSNQRLNLLLQIPAGSLPLKNGFYTKGKYLEVSFFLLFF